MVDRPARNRHPARSVARIPTVDTRSPSPASTTVVIAERVSSPALQRRLGRVRRRSLLSRPARARVEAARRLDHGIDEAGRQTTVEHVSSSIVIHVADPDADLEEPLGVLQAADDPRLARVPEVEPEQSRIAVPELPLEVLPGGSTVGRPPPAPPSRGSPDRRQAPGRAP
jgi:hypothetical protein